MTVVFRYETGEKICVGDTVLLNTTSRERVTMVIQPGTQEAKWYLCEDTGGVLIEPSMEMFSPRHKPWEDLEFIARGQPPRNEPSTKV